MTIPGGSVNILIREALQNLQNDLQDIDLTNIDKTLNDEINVVVKACVAPSFNKKGIDTLLERATKSLNLLKGQVADQKLKRVKTDLNIISALCLKYLSLDPKDFFFDLDKLKKEALELMEKNDDLGAIAIENIKDKGGQFTNSLLTGVYLYIIDELINKNKIPTAVKAADKFIKASELDIKGIQEMLYYHIIEKLIEKDEVKESIKIIEKLIKEDRIDLAITAADAEGFITKSPQIKEILYFPIKTALEDMISKGNKEEIDQLSETVKQSKNEDFKAFISHNIIIRKSQL